jgi:hypothetical protein
MNPYIATQDPARPAEPLIEMKRRLDESFLRDLADTWRLAGPDIVGALTEAAERADAGAVREIGDRLRRALDTLEAEVEKAVA